MLVTLFDHVALAESRYDCRAVKRGRIYFAQVWTEVGYWVVGEFDTRAKARHAAEQFAATEPVEPKRGSPRPANWHKRRSDSHRSRYMWVRKVKGGSRGGGGTFQSRPWCGPIGRSLNLGLYSTAVHGEDAEWTAGMVSKAFAREWKPGRTIGETVEALKHAKRACERVPLHVVVPKWQAELKPPTGYAQMVTKAEERHARLMTLADFATRTAGPLTKTVAARMGVSSPVPPGSAPTARATRPAELTEAPKLFVEVAEDLADIAPATPLPELIDYAKGVIASPVAATVLASLCVAKADRESPAPAPQKKAFGVRR